MMQGAVKAAQAGIGEYTQVFEQGRHVHKEPYQKMTFWIGGALIWNNHQMTQQSLGLLPFQ